MDSKNPIHFFEMRMQQKYNFEFYKLKIDFLTFKLEDSISTSEIITLASYLHESLGYNCFLSKGKTKKISEELYYIL